MRLPLDSLPQDDRIRHALLRDYFCDKDASAVLSERGWTVELAWPSDPARHVDPLLDDGLRWWGRGVERNNMAGARWRDGKILTALYDSWTLHSWSEWLARASADKVSNVVVLHVDDHRDLGSPRLFVKAGRLRDAITGQHVAMDDAVSVETAISSGAVGMGSFMTPFLHAVPTAEVRHLCQPPKTIKSANFHFVPTTVADTLLEPGVPRPSIDLVPGTGVGPGTYLQTNDLAAWTAGIAGRPALLHIDMDYFNNRYDGDSDWEQRSNRLEPEIDTILQKIDELVSALRTSDFGYCIEDVTIAFSPGFFPAELWRTADSRLRSGLKEML